MEARVDEWQPNLVHHCDGQHRESTCSSGFVFDGLQRATVRHITDRFPWNVTGRHPTKTRHRLNKQFLATVLYFLFRSQSRTEFNVHSRLGNRSHVAKGNPLFQVSRSNHSQYAEMIATTKTAIARLQQMIFFLHFKPQF